MLNSMGLHIEYAGTNSFSKIIGKVHGGGGRASLASIYNYNMVQAGAQNSLSGVGGNVLQAVILNDWDLVAGGSINLTSGVNSLVLNSIGPNTQVHLRDIPASLLPTALVANEQAVANSSSTSSGSSSSPFGSGSSSSSGVTPTLSVGAPTTISNSDGTTWTYVLGKNQSLTLAAVSGSFQAGTNVVEPLPTGQPIQTQHPAPPGIILKANTIDGAPEKPINLLTDSKIWGYDSTTGTLEQFDLTLANKPIPGQQTPYGTAYPNGRTITLPALPPNGVVGLNLGWNGTQLDLLVSSGTTVYAYDADTGEPDVKPGGSKGYFTTTNLSAPMQTIASQIISIGSTDTVTVLGSYNVQEPQYSNQLQMIDLATSLKTGMAQPPPGSTSFPAFTPAAGFTFLGGLTGVPGLTMIYGTVGATFNTFEPTQEQLGIQSANTVSGGLTYRFTPSSANAVLQNGTYTTVVAPPPLPSAVPQAGPALGSVDSNLALGIPPSPYTSIELLNPSTSSPGQTINIYTDKTLKTAFTDQLVALSGSFRPDLNGSGATGPALIDIQGDVQSFRGGSATGMVLNDSGNLNLVKFHSITNSTIVGQPLGHVAVAHEDESTTFLTPRRTVGGRGGVQVVKNLQQIGPLSFTGDPPDS